MDDEEKFLNAQAATLAERFNAAKYADVVNLALQALRRCPDWGFGWKLLGYAHAVQGQYEQALHPLLKASTAFPDEADLYNVLGTVFRAKGELDAAISAYLRAITLQSVFPAAYNNLGGAFMLKGSAAKAISAFVKAIEQSPQYPEAHQNLASAWLAQGKREEAIAALGQALALRPGNLEALGLSIHLRLQCVQWSNLQADVDRLRAQTVTEGFAAPAPFVFVTLPDGTREEQRVCALKFSMQQYQNFLSASPMVPPSPPRPPRPGGKLRIGYLSADLHEHATSYLLAGVLEQHDRKTLEIFAYSYGPNDASPTRLRIEAACDVFRDIQKLGHAAAARMIAEDGIDILVDLKGYTENARPEIIALRPAPVIVNWLGYPGTLGHDRLADYLIGDQVVTPLEHADTYSETLALMPHCYQPNDRQRKIGARSSRSDAGLPEHGFVFCSFNSMYKITPEVLDVWCNLLAQVPASVLWLLHPGERAADALRDETRQRGVDPARLIFAPKLPLEQHLGRLQLADLALDTYPVNSHTTASDALWAGVPLLTRIGETFVSRVAASLLHAVNLPELVTADWQTYSDKAISLATNPNELALLKSTLAQQLQICPLFDTQRFTRDIERLYQQMWLQFQSGQRHPIILDGAESLNEKSI